MAKIIDEKRYKKTTKKQVLKDREILRKSIIESRKNEKKLNDKKNEYYRKISSIDDTNKIFITNNNKNNYNVKKKKSTENSSFLIKILKVAMVIVAIFAISYLSKIIVKEDSNVVVETGVNNEKKITLLQNYDLKIGMSKLDTTDYLKSKNVILNELILRTNLSLIKFNEDYSFKYEVAEKIEKVSNKEYLVTLNDKFKIKFDDIKNSIEKIISVGESNIYYKALSNIKEVEKIDGEVIKFSLKEDYIYFTFYLDFPIFSEEYSYFNISNKDSKTVLFDKNKSEMSQIGTISFVNFSDSDKLIEEFRNGNIDIFTATSDSLINLIGKYDYNIKKYRNGETTFILGNKDSKLFSQKEVRQALAYSLNRDEIVKNISPKFSEVIDIPYIYSDVKYKYDIYGATNILIASGWEKNGGIYKKNIGGTNVSLELNLLVNEADSEKVKISELVKEMSEINGIKINIIKKKDNELMDCINNKQYDILLANININQVPDINFVKDYLNVTETINSAINILENSSIDELHKNLESLQNVLSSEIACIGILAKTSNIVYQKNINGFENIGYMKVFSELDKIGKIQSVSIKQEK